MRVVFIGNTVVSAEDLSRAANIPIVAPLSVTMISEAIGRIESAYAQRGYIASVSCYEITDEPASRTLTFHIREVTIASIRIAGLERTRETFILRVIGVQPGDVYDLFTVQQSVAALSQLGVFEDVSVALEQTAIGLNGPGVQVRRG